MAAPDVSTTSAPISGELQPEGNRVRQESHKTVIHECPAWAITHLIPEVRP